MLRSVFVTLALIATAAIALADKEPNPPLLEPVEIQQGLGKDGNRREPVYSTYISCVDCGELVGAAVVLLEEAGGYGSTLPASDVFDIVSSDLCPAVNYAAECTPFVNKYGGHLFKLLSDGETSSSEICTELGLCSGVTGSNPTPDRFPKPTPHTNTYTNTFPETPLPTPWKSISTSTSLEGNLCDFTNDSTNWVRAGIELQANYVTLDSFTLIRNSYTTSQVTVFVETYDGQILLSQIVPVGSSPVVINGNNLELNGRYLIYGTTTDGGSWGSWRSESYPVTLYHVDSYFGAGASAVAVSGYGSSGEYTTYNNGESYFFSFCDFNFGTATSTSYAS